MSRAAPLLPLFLVATPLLLVSWILFVSTISTPEMLAGAAASAAAAAAICAIEGDEHLRFHPRWRDGIQAAWVPWLLVQGTYEILAVSVRDLFHRAPAESAFQVAAFDAGRLGRPADCARRVLAVTYTTMAPNFIVLGINVQTDEMLFHQIHKTGVPQPTRSLGALP